MCELAECKRVDFTSQQAALTEIGQPFIVCRISHSKQEVHPPNTGRRRNGSERSAASQHRTPVHRPDTYMQRQSGKQAKRASQLMSTTRTERMRPLTPQQHAVRQPEREEVSRPPSRNPGLWEAWRLVLLHRARAQLARPRVKTSRMAFNNTMAPAAFT